MRRAQFLRYLHRDMTDPTRGAIDEYSLAGLEGGDIPQCLQSRDARHREGCRVLKGKRRRFDGEASCFRGDIFRAGTKANAAKNVIADSEISDGIPDPDNFSSNISAENASGLVNPIPGRMRYGSPRMRCQSKGLSDAALIFTRTWSDSGTGTATSLSDNTSGDP